MTLALAKDYLDFSNKKPVVVDAGHRIVSAAMRFDHNGFVLTSVRHFDPIVHAFLLKHPEYIDKDAEQGFVDNKGNFLSRTEAWKVAFDADQILKRVGGDMNNGGTLWSENLY